jgi:hypothetical protein
MTLKDIIVVSGHSGLFKHISKGRNIAVAENLLDSKRISISQTAKMSILEDITIFTDEEDGITLRQIFKNIQVKEDGGLAINHKSPDAQLKAYFEEVVPNYDREKVYVSDIRKVFNWYNILHQIGVTDFEKIEKETEDVKEEIVEN